LGFSIFVETLLQNLRLLKEERFLYHEDLRKKNTKWANGSRWLLALLGGARARPERLTASERTTTARGTHVVGGESGVHRIPRGAL
jgi:hypothetical protein